LYHHTWLQNRKYSIGYYWPEHDQFWSVFHVLEETVFSNLRWRVFNMFNKFRSLFFWWEWGLNSGLCTCKACTLPLEPHLQSIFLCLFWRWSLSIYLPGLALNHDPPNLSLPSS
jgi:hypothetical protein